MPALARRFGIVTLGAVLLAGCRGGAGARLTEVSPLVAVPCRVLAPASIAPAGGGALTEVSPFRTLAAATEDPEVPVVHAWVSEVDDPFHTALTDRTGTCLVPIADTGGPTVLVATFVSAQGRRIALSAVVTPATATASVDLGSTLLVRQLAATTAGGLAAALTATGVQATATAALQAAQTQTSAALASAASNVEAAIHTPSGALDPNYVPLIYGPVVATASIGR